MKRKNILWKIVLIIGILPFLVAFILGLYSGITGFSGLCILNCKDVYGIQAFVDSLIMYSYIFWPTYIIGLIMILISILLMKTKKRNSD